MGVNQQLTDQERVELTQKSYDELTLGQRVSVGKHFIGIVANSIYAEDGLRAFILTNPNEVTILFKGSYGIVKGNLNTWRDEWLKTNLPILIAMLINERRIPSQLKTAAQLLNKTMNLFKGQRFYLYGHSLGAINAQYALACCHHPQQIAGAYLYEGTNIWLLLNSKQRRRVNEMREKIYNYVDIYDPVTLGLTASHRMVGKLQYIDSEQMTPIKQHMWGGYRFDKQGNLKLKEVDEAFLKASKNERNLLLHSNLLANSIEKMGQKREFKKLANEKLLQWQKKHPDNKGLIRLEKLLNKKNNPEKY